MKDRQIRHKKKSPSENHTMSMCVTISAIARNCETIFLAFSPTLPSTRLTSSLFLCFFLKKSFSVEESKNEEKVIENLKTDLELLQKEIFRESTALT